MPLMTAYRLGYSEKRFRPANTTLTLANGAVTQHLGTLESLPIKVGGITVPTDFVILDLKDNIPQYLVLGRPFLSTTNTKIDCSKETIDLYFDNAIIRFDMTEPYLEPEWIPLHGKPLPTPCIIQKTLCTIQNPLCITQIPPGSHIVAFKVKMVKFAAGTQVIRIVAQWQKTSKAWKRKNYAKSVPYLVIATGFNGEDRYLFKLPPFHQRRNNQAFEKRKVKLNDFKQALCGRQPTR